MSDLSSLPTGSLSTAPRSIPLLSIEETVVHRKNVLRLPLEHASFKSITKRARPSTALASDAILTDLSTPYDISHRLPMQRRKRVVEEEPIDEPNLLNCVKPKSRPWIAPEREEAKQLRTKLEEMEKDAKRAAKAAPSEFEASTVTIEKTLQAHQKTLDEFVSIVDDETPERSKVLHRIADFYRQLAGEIPSIKQDFTKRITAAKDELARVKEERVKLEAERDEELAAVERQQKAADTLNAQIRDYQARCATVDKQLRDAQGEKMAMARSSQTNQQKLAEIKKQIREKKEQEKKLNELIETLSKDLTMRTKELESATGELKAMEDQIAKLRLEMANFKQIYEDRVALRDRLARTPLRDADKALRVSVPVQCNRIPKKQENKRALAAMNESVIDGKGAFAQIKSDLTLIQSTLGNPQSEHDQDVVVIRNFEDLAKVRQKILENNGIFDYSVDSIIRAHGADFDLLRTSEDEAQIYADWTMRRIMAKAVKWTSRANSGVQTDMLQEIVDNPDALKEKKEEDTFRLFDKSPTSLLQFIKNSRFIKMLDGDMSDRPPKSLDWLIHSIRSIYDEKTVDDRTNARDQVPIMDLPEYLLKWAFRQFGRDDLIQKGCWDLFITAHHYMQRLLEVTIFVRFLDEVLTTDQLTFFLSCRSWILQRCVSIPLDHDDLGVYFTETFLTEPQVHDFFRAMFPNTEAELIKDLAVRGCSCTDPGRVKDRDPACIQMNRVIELALGEEQDGRIRRIRRMLAFFKPVPRMTLKRFGVFVRSMICNIDPNMVDSLYRSGQTYNTVRVEMDQDAFVELFRNFDTPILPQGWEKDTISPEDFAELSEIYRVVYNRWTQFQPFVLRMLQNITPERFPGTETYVSEIRHLIFQLLEAKVSYDGVLFYQSYHRVLQTVMQTCLKLHLPDPASFGKQVGDFHGLLMRKFQAVAQ